MINKIQPITSIINPVNNIFLYSINVDFNIKIFFRVDLIQKKFYFLADILFKSLSCLMKKSTHFEKILDI